MGQITATQQAGAGVRAAWLWAGRHTRTQAATGSKAITLSGATAVTGIGGPNGRVCEQATANLVTNPSFEVDTAGWSTGTGNTLVRSTQEAWSGSAALRCAYGGEAGQWNIAQIAITLPAAIPTTYSAWVYVDPDFDGSLLRLHALGSFTGASGDGWANVDLAKKGEWQRVTFTFTPDAGDLSGVLALTTNIDETAGRGCYLDAVQVEQHPYPTTYSDGSLGGGYAWDGVAHASTSTRQASRVQVPTWPQGPCDSGSLAVHLRPGWAAADGNAHTVVERSAGGAGLKLHYPPAGDWACTATTAGGSTTVTVPATHAAGDRVRLVAACTPQTLRLSLDGGPAATATLHGALPDLDTERLVEVGRDRATAQAYLDGVVEDVGWFPGQPTPYSDRLLAALPALGGWQGARVALRPL